MAVSNAERQKQFRQRRKAEAQQFREGDTGNHLREAYQRMARLRHGKSSYTVEQFVDDILSKDNEDKLVKAAKNAAKPALLDV